MASSQLTFILVFVACISCSEGLRHQWTNRPLYSAVAKELSALHKNCPGANQDYVLYHLNNFGMGSSIGGCLVKATCNALQIGKPLRTRASGPSLSWIWTDEVFCSSQPAPYSNEITKNPLQCYFGDVFTPCPDAPLAEVAKKPHIEWQQLQCPRHIKHAGNYTGVADYSAAATEYMFSKLNPAVVRLAETEALKIFGPQGAPKKMITVHIRWGDKTHEMGGSLVHIDEYVRAVQFFVKKHELSEVNVFLTTEDSRAAEMFKTHPTVLGNKWTVFEYAEAVSKNKALHTPALDATESRGKFGLISLIVLLLSMEAQYFVLTTASNWSILIQSLANGVASHTGEIDYVDLRRNPLMKKLQHDFTSRNKLPKNYPFNDAGVLAFPIGSSIS